MLGKTHFHYLSAPDLSGQWAFSDFIGVEAGWLSHTDDSSWQTRLYRDKHTISVTHVSQPWQMTSC